MFLDLLVLLGLVALAGLMSYNVLLMSQVLAYAQALKESSETNWFTTIMEGFASGACSALVEKLMSIGKNKFKQQQTQEAMKKMPEKDMDNCPKSAMKEMPEEELPENKDEINWLKQFLDCHCRGAASSDDYAKSVCACIAAAQHFLGREFPMKTMPEEEELPYDEDEINFLRQFIECRGAASSDDNASTASTDDDTDSGSTDNDINTHDNKEAERILRHLASSNAGITTTKTIIDHETGTKVISIVFDWSALSNNGNTASTEETSTEETSTNASTEEAKTDDSTEKAKTDADTEEAKTDADTEEIKAKKTKKMENIKIQTTLDPATMVEGVLLTSYF